MLQIGAVLQQFEADLGVAFLRRAQQCCPIILKKLCRNLHIRILIYSERIQVCYRQPVPTASSALTSAPWLMSSRTKCSFPLVAAKMRAVLLFCNKKIIIYQKIQRFTREMRRIGMYEKDFFVRQLFFTFAIWCSIEVLMSISFVYSLFRIFYMIKRLLLSICSFINLFL